MKPEFVFVGLPGAGKTSVGRILAERLGAAFTDTDAAFTSREGITPARYIEQFGLENFRHKEASHVADALRQTGIVSLGGGSVLAPGVKEALAEHQVIWLDAADEALAERVKADTEVRPLLLEDPGKSNKADLAQAVARLRRHREQVYGEVSSIHLATDGLEPSLLAEIIVASKEKQGATLPLYLDTIGESSTALTAFLSLKKCSKVFFVATEDMREVTESLRKRISSIGLQTRIFFHQGSEEAKTPQTAALIWGELEDFELARNDFIVSVGGGVTSDLAGFVASTWHRGVRLIHYPTTTLGMIDAALGGKTGVDGLNGKNQIGTFYVPDLVLSHFSVLETLPKRDFRAGLVEALKCGIIADKSLLDLFLSSPMLSTSSWALGQGLDTLKTVVFRADQIKNAHVEADLFDRGIREFLNFGHTVGHAIESASDYQIKHGEAVALGMKFAAELSVHLCSLAADHKELICKAIDILQEKPIEVPSWHKMFKLLRQDKKRRDANHRMILLRSIADPVVMPVTDEALNQTAADLGWG